jgi:hypothetical protein
VSVRRSPAGSRPASRRGRSPGVHVARRAIPLLNSRNSITADDPQRPLFTVNCGQNVGRLSAPRCVHAAPEERRAPVASGCCSARRCRRVPRRPKKPTAMPDSGPRQRVENPRNFFGNSRSVRQAEVAPVPPQAGRFIEVTRRTWRRPFQRNGKSRAVVRLAVPDARPINLAARPSDQHLGRAIFWVPCCRVGRFCRRCRLTSISRR